LLSDQNSKRGHIKQKSYLLSTKRRIVTNWSVYGVRCYLFIICCLL